MIHSMTAYAKAEKMDSPKETVESAYLKETVGYSAVSKETVLESKK